jgi:pSer/pThr/pTyr-binding forkhead associated (FHA) protein
MTSHAPSSARTDRLQEPQQDAAERDTRLLRPEHVLGVDAYGLLDHRTRDSTLLQDVAPPGRYLAVEHDGRSRLIALSRPITHIGRGLVADVRLEDPHVSRRHAIVAIRGDGPDAVRVLDDRSSGGTFVNGTPVTVAQLHDGDIVRVGRVWFRYTEIAPEVKRRRTLRRIPLSTARRPSHVRPAAA